MAIAWFPVLALSTMNESRSFSVETVQTIGLLVDESVILRNELPANFRRIDGGGVGHDEAEFGWQSVRLIAAKILNISSP